MRRSESARVMPQERVTRSKRLFLACPRGVAWLRLAQAADSEAQQATKGATGP